MGTLTLGVENVSYADELGGSTTGEVAEILEAKYSVMHTFLDLHMDKVANAVSDRYADLMEERISPIGKILPMNSIESDFRDYLDNDEWQRHTGRVILAAKMGVSNRKKKKKYSGSRPAFIDTGLYSRMFRSILKI